MKLFVKKVFIYLAFLFTLIASGLQPKLAFAQNRAQIEAPTGTVFEGNDKIEKARKTVNYLMLIAGVIPATLFMIFAGRHCNAGDWGQAFGSFLGAVIAGLAGYLAFAFI